MAGLKVNFSNEEASAETFDFEPLPTGKYPVMITDGSMEESKSAKNLGKPYWHLELTVEEGHANAGRKFWANVMLFEGALYSLAQLDKALDEEFAIVKTGKVPDLDALIGRSIVVRVAKQRDTYREEKQTEAGERQPSDPPLFKNEVKGYLKPSALSSAASGGAAKGSSLLP